MAQVARQAAQQVPQQPDPQAVPPQAPAVAVQPVPGPAHDIHGLLKSNLLPHYDGLTNDLYTYLDRLGALNDIEQWDADRRLAAYKIGFSGLARQWLDSLTPVQQRLPWADFRILMINRFQDPQARFMAETNLMSTRFSPTTQTIDKHFSEIISACRALNKTEPEMISIFCASLPPDMRRFVALKNDNLQNAHGAARLYMQTLTTSGNVPINVVMSGMSNTQSSFDAQVNHVDDNPECQRVSTGHRSNSDEYQANHERLTRELSYISSALEDIKLDQRDTKYEMNKLKHRPFRRYSSPERSDYRYGRSYRYSRRDLHYSPNRSGKKRSRSQSPSRSSYDSSYQYKNRYRGESRSRYKGNRQFDKTSNRGKGNRTGNSESLN